jgi:hypothetical protein
MAAFPVTIDPLNPALHLRAWLSAPTALLAIVVVLASVLWLGGCAAAFGPGYTVDKQNVDVKFVPGPPPRISLKANYELINVGTRPLTTLELRLPGSRRFLTDNLRVKWDGREISTAPSADRPRNTLLNLPEVWAIDGHHSLQLEMEFQTGPGDQHIAFAPDAFFLPAQGWAPELVPPEGLFALGGVPPDKWILTVHLPKDFAVHTSGDRIRISKHHDEQTVRATQRLVDFYPFVIAGHYVPKPIGSDRERIFLWTRKQQSAGDLQSVGDDLVKTIHTYNNVLGVRTPGQVPPGFLGRTHHQDPRHDLPLWLVECPVLPGCFTESSQPTAALLGEKEQPKSAEMVSLDSAMIDANVEGPKTASAAAPAFAATWLGYGENPGFYHQDPPLSALPAFAAALSHDSVNGSAARTETIRRALALVPVNNPKAETDPAVLRAKSFLFFFGLEDRYGDEVFRKAVRHMLDARRGSGFDLDDLIAAFDEETHANTAEFVRHWMKRPGVPADFRAKYENTSAQKNDSTKEITP